MKYVIYGAGAIGATIGGLLAHAGQQVSLIARGQHREVMAANGLTLRGHMGELNLALPVYGDAGECPWDPDDVCILAMKAQDTAAAVRSLQNAAPPSIAVVCAQNGVENERIALRSFADVYAMPVVLPSDYLEPGIVTTFGHPVPGVLNVGRFPSGVDARAEQIAADLVAAGFRSAALPDVMRAKYRKLTMNLVNGIQTLVGNNDDMKELAALARQEGFTVMDAAGIDYQSADEDQAQREGFNIVPLESGESRLASSSWQSLVRGRREIEADYLNGEIVLLGRLVGVPTPVNQAVQELSNELAQAGGQPGSVPRAVLEERISALSNAQ